MNNPHLIRNDNTIIPINKSPFLMGRSLSCDYVLPFKEVSRNHCQFERRESCWYLKNISINGTFLNDELIAEHVTVPIKDNDVIEYPSSSELKYTFKTNEFDGISDEELSRTCDNMLQNLNNQTVAVQENRVNKQMNTNSAPLAVDDVIDLTEDSILEVREPSSSVITLNDSTMTIPEPKVEPMNCQPSTSAQPSNKSRANVNTEMMDEELKCSICAEIFIKAMTLNCSHTFCQFCIYTWSAKNNTCPVCRVPIKNMTHTLLIDNIVEKVIETLPQEEKNTRKSIIDQRNSMNLKKPKACKNITNVVYVSNGLVTQTVGHRGLAVAVQVNPYIERNTCHFCRAFGRHTRNCPYQ